MKKPPKIAVRKPPPDTIGWNPDWEVIAVADKAVFQALNTMRSQPMEIITRDSRSGGSRLRLTATYYVKMYGGIKETFSCRTMASSANSTSVIAPRVIIPPLLIADEIAPISRNALSNCPRVANIQRLAVDGNTIHRRTGRQNQLTTQLFSRSCEKYCLLQNISSGKVNCHVLLH